MAWRVCTLVSFCVFLFCKSILLVYDVIVFDDWHPAPHCARHFPPNYTAIITPFIYYLSKLVSPSATTDGCRFLKLNLWMSGVIFRPDRTSRLLLAIVPRRCRKGSSQS
ncbi:unnamed protein product [Onchocerca flexuosa]|uniref:Secreted protein n=1 Tax=Onchocerca flexuosa TaxID=387005 RepID=A0A183GYT0_9BILA|nr:unnamed protein product [Onchocerca flexuosa]